MEFTTALTAVAVMLVYAIPGFLLIRTKLLSPDKIVTAAVMLVYIFAPFQTIDAMQRITYSPRMTGMLFLTIAIGLVLMGGMMAGLFGVFFKRQKEVKFRILTIAGGMGNCGFMGIPLLESMLPNYPEAVAFATGFFVAMNVLMWSAASAIIMHDKHFVSLRKIFLNPSMFAMYAALILYFGRIQLTGKPMEMVSVLSKTCTPLCMIILGMRLGAVKIKGIFTDPMQYLASALKLIVYPLLAYGLVSLLPVEHEYAQTIYLLCSVPIANLVLSFAEMLGEGQDTAANVVLLSTLMSVITIPVMTLVVR